MVSRIPQATKTLAARMGDLLPVFTPSPNCLQDIYILTTSCSSTKTCTYFHIGPTSSDATCVPDPGRHLATECPAFYTPVYSNAALTTRTGLNGVRGEVLTCCPTGFGFDWPRKPETKGPQFVFGCVATTPVMLERGPGPWQVTATDTRGNVRAITINPEVDVLEARSVFVELEISRGVSCAPGCATPWRSGDPWPLPETTSSWVSTGISGGGANWNAPGVVGSFIGIAVGCLVALLSVCLCGYLFFTSRIKRPPAEGDGTQPGQLDGPSRLGIRLRNRAASAGESGSAS